MPRERYVPEAFRSVAFADQARRQVTLVLQNTGTAAADLSLRLGRRFARLHLEAGTVATVSGSAFAP